MRDKKMDTLVIRPVNVKTVDFDTQHETIMRKKRQLDLEYYNIVSSMIKGATGKDAAYNLVLKRLVDVENELTDLFSRVQQDDYKRHYVVLEESKNAVPFVVKVAEDKKQRKGDKKQVKKALSPEQKAQLLRLNANALARAGLKFKTIEECKSQARTKPYYMAKDELIKAIERDEELRKRMPAKYKTMKKEDICMALGGEQKN